jgi:hypothetical protein
LEHRRVKNRYKRTSKKRFVSQLARIERRQARIRRIREKILKEGKPVAENIPRDPKAHHEIGVSENWQQRFSSFLQAHKDDPAAVVSFIVAKLNPQADILVGFLAQTQGALAGSYSRGTGWVSSTPDSRDRQTLLQKGVHVWAQCDEDQLHNIRRTTRSRHHQSKHRP